MTRDDIDSIHTCHDECQRPACVAGRKAVAKSKGLERFVEAKMSKIKPEDHPDFVGGWTWTKLELDWINERIGTLEEAVAAERNKLAAWVIRCGFATGHGDTMEQLLEELSVEIRARANTHQPGENTHQGVAQARPAERLVSYVCPQCFYTLEEKQWVGLTRDERMEIINRLAGQDWVYVVDEIEAKLKEKNQNERTN